MAEIGFGVRTGTFEAASLDKQPIEDVVREAFYHYLIEEEAKQTPAAADISHLPQPAFNQEDFDSITVRLSSTSRPDNRRYKIEMPQSVFDRIDDILVFKFAEMSGFINRALDSHLAKVHIESSFDS